MFVLKDGFYISTFSTSDHLSVQVCYIPDIATLKRALNYTYKKLALCAYAIPSRGAISPLGARTTAIFLFLARTQSSCDVSNTTLFESSCISEENAVFRPVLSFLFDSISIVHVYDCFVCTFVTGKEKSRILSRSLIGPFAQLHSP